MTYSSFQARKFAICERIRTVSQFAFYQLSHRVWWALRGRSRRSPERSRRSTYNRTRLIHAIPFRFQEKTVHRQEQRIMVSVKCLIPILGIVITIKVQSYKMTFKLKVSTQFISNQIWRKTWCVKYLQWYAGIRPPPLATDFVRKGVLFPLFFQ